MLAEQAGKEARVVVAHFVADRLDALARGREQGLGRFDAQALQVVQGLVAGGRLETTHEVADAHAVFACDILEAKLVREMRFEPFLDLQYAGVEVELLAAEADSARAVVALHFEQHVARHALGDVRATEALHQIHVQIAGRGGAAGAIEIVAVGHVLVGGELHPREASTELFGEAPMRGRFLVIQQPGRGHPERACRLSADRAALRVTLAQPG